MAKNNKKLFEKAIVQKRNVLNEIRKNNMSLSELRLFSIYLSKINSRDISTRLVRFPLEDFQKIIGISVGTDNITHFRNTIIKLLQQVVEIPNERGGYTAFQLFKQVEVAKDEFEQWYVEIDAHDKALPLMFDFKNRYFSYELWNALRLKSSNQIRMYEILKQYENIGKREITVTELKNLLGIAPTEYPRWDNFKIKVLDSCKQALAENTDITFTYEKGKSGQSGKWLTIIFHIQKNKNHVDDLSLSDFIAQTPYIESEVMEANDIISQLSKVCNYDFTREEIQSAYNFAKTFVHDKAIKTYFEQTYLKLLEIEKNKKIRNRFKYFYSIICNDADRQRKEEQDREQTTGYPAAYDLAEYESTYILDELDDRND
jgi:plasmid replication initiation protein